MRSGSVAETLENLQIYTWAMPVNFKLELRDSILQE